MGFQTKKAIPFFFLQLIFRSLCSERAQFLRTAKNKMNYEGGERICGELQNWAKKQVQWTIDSCDEVKYGNL